jgi:hypothetical protein
MSSPFRFQLFRHAKSLTVDQVPQLHVGLDPALAQALRIAILSRTLL